MNPDPRAPEAAQRIYVALLLSSLGFLPWPLRYSPAEPPTGPKRYWRTGRTENWSLLRQLSRLGAAHPWSRSAVEGLNFERPCDLQILTGSTVGVVAVSSWTIVGEMWICLQLPDTPVVLTNMAGRHCFYRSPSNPVWSGYVRVADDRTMIRICGEMDAVTVPPSAFDAIEGWPAVDALPQFDPAWLPGGRR